MVICCPFCVSIIPFRLSLRVLSSIVADTLRRVLALPFTSMKQQVSFTNCTAKALSMSMALKVSPRRRSSVVVLLSNRVMKPFSSKLFNVFTIFGIDNSNVLIDIIVAMIHIANQSHPQPDLRGVLSWRIRRIVAIMIDMIGMSRAISVEIMKVKALESGIFISELENRAELRPVNALPMPVIMPIRAIVSAPITIMPIAPKKIPTIIAAMRNSHFTISPRREPTRLADSWNCSLFR